MNKPTLKQDIIGCLDYALRHSSWFSGVRGDFDDASCEFRSDDGVVCSLKIRFEIDEIDTSDIVEKWEDSEEETKMFLELSELWLAGDKDILRADDPSNLCLGLFRELSDGSADYGRISINRLKTNYPELMKHINTST